MGGGKQGCGWLWLGMGMERCQLLGLGLHEAADLGRRAPVQPLIPGQGVDRDVLR